MAEESKAVQIRKEKFKTVRTLFEQKKGQIAMALPRHMDPDRMLRIALSSIARNPLLLECTPESLLGAVMQSTILGLEPDGILGRAHLIPYKNNKKGGIYEAQFQAGYKGLVELAYRSDRIDAFSAQIVHENDIWEYEEGINPKLKHIPARKDRGEPIAAYAVAHIKGGATAHVWMWKEDIEAIRDQSSIAWRYQKDQSVWGTNPDAMWRKTVAKQLCKWLPLSPELAKAVALDDQADAGIAQDLDIIGDPEKVIDVDQDQTATGTQEKQEALREKLQKKTRGRPPKKAEPAPEPEQDPRVKLNCPGNPGETRYVEFCEGGCTEVDHCHAYSKYAESMKE